MVLCNLSGHSRGWGLPGHCRDPYQGGKLELGSLGLSYPPARELDRWGTATALGISHLPGDRARLRPWWDISLWVGPPWWGPRPGCEELETSPAAALLGQGPMALGELGVGSWAPGGGPGGSWSGQGGRARSAIRALKQLLEMSPTTAEDEKGNFWALSFERPVTKTNPIKLEGPVDLGWNGESQSSKRG